MWRRLKGHTPAVAAGAAVAAGVMAAGQLASGATSGAAPGLNRDAGSCPDNGQSACQRDEQTCRVNMVSTYTQWGPLYIYGTAYVCLSEDRYQQ